MHLRRFCPRCAKSLALILLFLFAATLHANAQQSAHKGWTRITDTNSRNIDEVTSARTSDGVLHVVWQSQKDHKQGYVHTTIGANGEVSGQPTTVLENWDSLNKPNLLADKGGLVLFFSGVRGSSTTDPYSAGCLFHVKGNESGTTWTLQPGCGSVSHSVYSGGLGATLALDGTPVVAWGAHVQIGLSAKTADQNHQSGCCSYSGNVATDGSSGDVVLGWYSNANKEHGLYTLTVLPKAGEKQFVPGSATADHTSSVSLDQRMPLTARRGAAGVYVAYCAGYPSCKSVNVWKHGDQQPLIVDKRGGAREVNIAAGPEGRLWVMWSRGVGLYAVRSNRAATRFGAIQSVAPPKGTGTVWHVSGEGSGGPLDLFAAVSTPGSLATWHTQVFPPLALSASPSKVNAAVGGAVTFTVTDVGDPVEGATVTMAGKELKTDSGGKASMTLPKGAKAGALMATATQEGYRSATASVSVYSKGAH